MEANARAAPAGWGLGCGRRMAQTGGHRRSLLPLACPVQRCDRGGRFGSSPMTMFFTADTHFGHGGALGLYRRPFASVAAMDAAMIAAWQDTVGPEDEVWHLGDFAVGRRVDAAALLAVLPGRKHLVIGNNDPAATTGLPGWASVQHYAEAEIGRHPNRPVPLRLPDLARSKPGRVEPAWAQPWPAEARSASGRCGRRCLGLSSGHLGGPDGP